MVKSEKLRRAASCEALSNCISLADRRSVRPFTTRDDRLVFEDAHLGRMKDKLHKIAVSSCDRDTETDDREVRLENCEPIINGAESRVTTHPNYIERKSHVSERRSAHIYIYI